MKPTVRHTHKHRRTFLVAILALGITTVCQLQGADYPTAAVNSTGRIKFKDVEMVGMPEYQIVRSGIGRKFQTPRSTRTSRSS
jgi:ABC-type uncharacterized transport system ATPase subunit